MTVIYLLCDPVSGDCRYVGKTSQPFRKRYIAHLIAARRPKTPVHWWINKLINQGKKPFYIFVPLGDGVDWRWAEVEWINSMRERGCDLLNLAPGGQGVDIGYKRDAVVVKKMRERAAALRNGFYRKCTGCEVLIYVTPWHERAGWKRHCSRACYEKYQRGKPKAIHKARLSIGQMEFPSRNAN